jgi:hypothetical protein
MTEPVFCLKRPEWRGQAVFPRRAVDAHQGHPLRRLRLNGRIGGADHASDQCDQASTGARATLHVYAGDRDRFARLFRSTWLQITDADRRRMTAVFRRDGTRLELMHG